MAGADDLGAIWYNPAGLADAGTTIYADFTWLNYSAEFTRKTQVADANGTLRTYDYPQVSGKTPILPLPTIGGTYNFGEKKEYTAAFGILAPYAAISTFPLTLNGQPAPQRYSLVSMDGSALAVIGGYFAYKPIEQVRIGGGVEAIVGKFRTTTVFSASPNDRLIGAPEDPQYDAFARLDVGIIVAPSANLGVTLVPEKHVRIGISGQLPFWVNAPATVDVRLPTAAPFDKAHQDGNEARVKFRLPPVARIGVQYQVDFEKNDYLQLELAYVREFWSLHDSIDIESKGIKLYDITGFPSPFGVAPISIPRNFKDSNSIRAGFEYSTKSIFSQNRTDLRGGISYETSAIPREWVTPLTYDANKIIGSAGGSIHVAENWRFDAVLGIVLYQGTTVDPAEAQSPRINPVRGNPTATEAVNGGEYSARSIVLGVGAQYKF